MLLTALTSCGAVYQHIVVPVDVNLDNTAVYAGEGRAATHHISVDASVDWGDHSIGAAARRGGLDTVHYADLEVFSVLSVYRKETLHLYGTVAPQP